MWQCDNRKPCKFDLWGFWFYYFGIFVRIKIHANGFARELDLFFNSIFVTIIFFNYVRKGEIIK